tara:strand:+ start:127 stop:309 length:183 start_codon:yes stop_codon:yes gene_type:complete
MSKPKQKVTQGQVEFWLGSDHTLKEAIEALTYIANGEYKPELLSKEVLDYSKQFGVNDEC